jgi:hypothetical protein
MLPAHEHTAHRKVRPGSLPRPDARTIYPFRFALGKIPVSSVHSRDLPSSSAIRQALLLGQLSLIYTYWMPQGCSRKERCIYPASVANESSLHNVSSSVGYLLHGKESKGRHAWVGVYRRDSPDEDSASSLGDPLSRLGDPRNSAKHRPHRPQRVQIERKNCKRGNSCAVDNAVGTLPYGR